MKKDISRKDMERILKQEVKVPEIVNQRIGDTYEKLGIHTRVSMRYTRNHRVLVAAATVAMLALGMSAVTYAASKFLSADLVEKDDKVGYDFQVDKEREAHEIEATATYMPEGYVLGEENSPYGGKWHNYDTDGSISILPYNAAELERLQRLGMSGFLSYPKDDHIKEMEISGMKTDVFVSDNFYTDSEKSVKNIYLFNEEYGYAVQVWSESDLPAEELIKVAEGLKVTVLDTVIPYATEEELEAEKAEIASMEKDQGAKEAQGVPKSSVFGIGEKVRDPLFDENDKELCEGLDDIRYKVKEVEIKDSLSLDEYPAENYIDYENSVALWVNPDGTLKPRDRYTYPVKEEGNTITREGTLETVQSKYVVVKMWAKNYSDTQTQWNKEGGVNMAPYLTTLEPREDGSYGYPLYDTDSANEDYHLQGGADNGSSFPVYFDKMSYTEGVQRLKHSLFRPMVPGEELEYTLIYIVDEDMLDNMYLWFYSGDTQVRPDGTWLIAPYVRISD